jgi:hypothetical protein
MRLDQIAAGHALPVLAARRARPGHGRPAPRPARRGTRGVRARPGRPRRRPLAAAARRAAAAARLGPGRLRRPRRHRRSPGSSSDRGTAQITRVGAQRRAAEPARAPGNKHPPRHRRDGRAQPPRAGSTPAAAHRPIQRRNRRRTAQLGAHNRAPRQRHPRQARVAQPRRSRRLRRLDRNGAAAEG